MKRYTTLDILKEPYEESLEWVRFEDAELAVADAIVRIREEDRADKAAAVKVAVEAERKGFVVLINDFFDGSMWELGQQLIEAIRARGEEPEQ